MALHEQKDGDVPLLGKIRYPLPLARCSALRNSVSNLDARLCLVDLRASLPCALAVHLESSFARTKVARHSWSRSLAVRLGQGRPSWLSAVCHESNFLSQNDAGDARMKAVFDL